MVAQRRAFAAHPRTPTLTWSALGTGQRVPARDRAEDAPCAPRRSVVAMRRRRERFPRARRRADLTREVERASGNAVRAVGADQRIGGDALACDAHLRTGRGDSDGVDARPVAELDPGLDRLLGQERVEARGAASSPPAARASGARTAAGSRARTQMCRSCPRRPARREGQQAKGAPGQAAAGRAVARGKRALSTMQTRAPARARRYAAVSRPARPRHSRRSAPRLDRTRRGYHGRRSGVPRAAKGNGL